MSESVEVRRVGAVATVVMARPDIANAVTPEQAGQLRQALETLVADPATTVVVVTGSGSSFNVGGFRPKGHDQPAETDPLDVVATYERQVPTMRRVLELLGDARIVSVAAINGACAGAGLALALAADLRFASERAGFNTAFLSAGLPGELGAIWRMSRLAGPGRAAGLFLAPGRVSARQLLDAGILNGVEPDDRLEAAVAELAARIAGYDPEVVRAMKANLNDASSLTLADYLAEEHRRIVECLGRAGRPTQRNITRRDITK